MNILVIGNGFDIAHGLPTTYKDFLKFVEQICRIEVFHGYVNEFESKNEQFNELDTGVAKYIDTVIRHNTKPHMAVKDIYKNQQNFIIDEIIQLAKKNYWIEWFQKSETLIEDGWIDCESEISRVIQRFEEIYKLIPCKISNLSEDEQKTINFFLKAESMTDRITKSGFMKYKEIMTNDLNRLIRCLELYLEDCVRNIDKSLLSTDIYNLAVDKVLSFNYTDTYTRLYSCKNRNIEYDYIHGKSKINQESANNMVLGIDEYLNNDECRNNTIFIEFKKYFQRIHKATGCSYKGWLEEIEESNCEEHNVYIFGHSLDCTDKDVLEELITNDKVRTSIFYKDAEQYGKQIANLVKLLKKDVLISMTYANNPKIKFVLQKPMIDKQNSEWQILNDINSLWKLHELNTAEIIILSDRINQKIEGKNLSYFYNQRKVISLYDALIPCGWCNEKNRNILLDIAYLLFDEEELIIQLSQP